MDKKNILYAFIAVCVLYFFSSLLELEGLELLSKPLFLPLLLFYYIKKARGNFQNRVIISFIFYYIAELLVLVDGKQFYLISVSFFLIPYMILLYFITKDLLLHLKKKGYNKFNFTIFFIIGVLVYLGVNILLIIDTTSVFEQLLLYAYGLVLLLMAVFSIAMYFLKHSSVNLFLIMTVIAFLVSDIFYILIVKIEYSWVFKSVNLISQLLSYYFFVIYSLIKLKGNNER